MEFESADAEIREARERATAGVVDSDHRLRVIVAGPGTGKTTTFERAILRRGTGSLALTFLKTLSGELQDKLSHCATGSTFHAYAKQRIHSLSPPGLSPHFSLYPALAEIQAQDIAVLGLGAPSVEDLEAAIQNLDEGNPLIELSLRLGTYYDSASFEGIVFRLFDAFRADPSTIPEYPLVVVDEYQDFSLLETKLIDLLGTRSHLLIAGDDDQALYGFRHASARYIRELARSARAERHELPFCGRCTDVVVRAVQRTVRRATDIGLLNDRLDKRFECFMPDKRPANLSHPHILDVRCSTNPVMGKYVVTEIGKIPADDIAASVAGRHYTALIIGQKQFTRPIHERLVQGDYPYAGRRSSGKIRPQLLDGYGRLAKNPLSNLGWRILLHFDRPPGWEDAVRGALDSGRPLASYLPEDYRVPRLGPAELVRALLDGEKLEADAMSQLSAAVRVPAEGIEAALHAAEERDEEAATSGRRAPGVPDDPTLPSILVTSLNGAKGLSAEHVFVVGCMNGYFPEDPARPTDQEVSQLIVALSRTRKTCHLISCKVFHPQRNLAPSVFVTWLGGLTEPRPINAASLR